MTATISMLKTAYRVYFFRNEIFTIITSDDDTVAQWINEIQSPGLLIVGVGIHFCDSEDSTVAAIELCAGDRCLIYKFDPTAGDFYPSALSDFLRNGEYIFVGDGDDLGRFDKHRFIIDVSFVDIRRLTLERFVKGGKDVDIRNEGGQGPRPLWELAVVVLEKELWDIPDRLMRWRWDSKREEDEMVMYSCAEAFMLFEMGRVLDAREYKIRHRG